VVIGVAGGNGGGHRSTQLVVHLSVSQRFIRVSQTETSAVIIPPRAAASATGDGSRSKIGFDYSVTKYYNNNKHVNTWRAVIL